MDQVRNGTAKWHFIEVMACPGGCINGGGQPKTALPPSDEVRMARINALYSIDEKATLRLCHENPEIKTIYKDFFGEPCGHLSHELLHTRGYEDHSMHLTRKKIT
jgi:iron only hydrogenase large subunit-like protein